MPLEGGVDGEALYTDAAAVDEAYFNKPARVSFRDVVLDHRRYVPRCERVKIQCVPDRNLVRHFPPVS